jgi:hypothetical protein
LKPLADRFRDGAPTPSLNPDDSSMQQPVMAKGTDRMEETAVRLAAADRTVRR